MMLISDESKLRAWEILVDSNWKFQSVEVSLWDSFFFFLFLPSTFLSAFFIDLGFRERVFNSQSTFVSSGWISDSSDCSVVFSLISFFVWSLQSFFDDLSSRHFWIDVFRFWKSDFRPRILEESRHSRIS